MKSIEIPDGCIVCRHFSGWAGPDNKLAYCERHDRTSDPDNPVCNFANFDRLSVKFGGYVTECKLHGTQDPVRPDCKLGDFERKSDIWGRTSAHQEAKP